MAEYIEREAFSEVLEAAIKMQELAVKMMDAEDDPELQMSLKVYNDILSGIKEFPAADVAPVKHGTWTWDRLRESYHCSGCAAHNADRTAYCPNCGAKMDGGRDDGH